MPELMSDPVSILYLAVTLACVGVAGWLIYPIVRDCDDSPKGKNRMIVAMLLLIVATPFAGALLRGNHDLRWIIREPFNRTRRG